MKKIKNIKIGDRIQVITGNQKGNIGNVSSINKKKEVVTIDTITPRIKYAKSRQGEETKQVELQIPIHISNVMLWDDKQNRSDKIGYKIVDGKKTRYFKKSGNIL